MRILIVDNGTSYLKNLEALFAGDNIKVIKYSRIAKIKNIDADLVVLSGGHGSPVLSKRDPYRLEIDFIQHATVPILGVCLGYELIAHAFKAELTLMKNREQGILKIVPIRKSPLFKGIKKFSVYESHRWVVKKIPKGLIGLAKSKDGYEIIAHTGSPFIYGVQFHPEMFVQQTSGSRIFKNLLRMRRSLRN
jgi:anthranilate/para-aminobenzoate synthase component II